MAASFLLTAQENLVGPAVSLQHGPFFLFISDAQEGIQKGQMTGKKGQALLKLRTLSYYEHSTPWLPSLAPFSLLTQTLHSLLCSLSQLHTVLPITRTHTHMHPKTWSPFPKEAQSRFRAVERKEKTRKSRQGMEAGVSV